MPSVARAVVHTIAYLLPSFRGSPPLHQEIVALGEAWGRHSKTISPPLWITVDFFTGRRVKSGGEAEEQTRVKAICLALWRSNSCASAENVKCITSNYRNCISPPDWLMVWKNYVNERQRPCLSEELVQPLLIYSFIFREEALLFHWWHNVHTLMSWPTVQFIIYDAKQTICLPTTLSSALA